MSSLSEKDWPRLATHGCWALSQRRLGLVTGTLTIQLVRMGEDTKEEPSESPVMTSGMDKMYFWALFSFSVLIMNCN